MQDNGVTLIRLKEKGTMKRILVVVLSRHQEMILSVINKINNNLIINELTK